MLLLTGKVIEMEYWFWPILRLLAGLITVLGSGGIRAVLAENLIFKQQLLVMRRSRRRAPNLRTADRVLFGFCAQFLSPRRLLRTAIILKHATLLRFHRGFKDFKYRFLYSSSPKRKPGPKGPSPELIRAICELKQRNPRFGCPKIAQHLAKTFGIDLDKDVVRRVPAAHYRCHWQKPHLGRKHWASAVFPGILGGMIRWLNLVLHLAVAGLKSRQSLLLDVGQPCYSLTSVRTDQR